MRRFYRVLPLFFCASVLADNDISFRGNVSGEWRYYPDSPQYEEQLQDNQLSFSAKPEMRYKLNRDNVLTFVPFYRFDQEDDERSHGDIREAHWLYLADDWELLVGINQVFWGVTESWHLVDVINQVDAVENLNQEEKLGQPMVHFSMPFDMVDLDVYWLPYFRERTYIGAEGRLRAPLTVDKDLTEYESHHEQRHNDFAVRLSTALDSWDIGAYVFSGTSREPRLQVNASSELLAFYDLINQFGTDIQYTQDEWLWKFEGLVREGQGSTFAAAVAGFEYTFFQIGESSTDVGVLVEYLYDGRDSDPEKAPVVFTQNDLFLGSRITWNDTLDKALLMGLIVDLDDDSTILSVEYEQRLNDYWSIEFESRWFTSVDEDNALIAFEQDSFAQLTISRYF